MSENETERTVVKLTKKRRSRRDPKPYKPHRNDRCLLPQMHDPAWELQRNENPQVYAQFVLYRDLGPTRTLQAVADETGISYKNTVHNAKRWRWQERALLWEKHLDRLRTEEFERGAKTMGARQAKLGMMLQDKAVEALAIVDLSEPTVKDVVALAETGSKIERAARGEKVDEDHTVVIQLPMVPDWARGSKVIQVTPPQLEGATDESNS